VQSMYATQSRARYAYPMGQIMVAQRWAFRLLETLAM
jgi:hypothetical protein